MTKTLETLLNINTKAEKVISPKSAPVVTTVNLQRTLEEFDKISEALPKVKGLGDASDAEFDALATKAEQAYDDLMDLGMNIEARYSARMFEVAAGMLNAAISAKNSKIDKKLKMIDLQLKKLAIDKKHTTDDEPKVSGEGYIVTDRNSILERLKNMK